MDENEWFILIGQERQGPMSVHDVRYLLTRRSIDGGTLIWREGMDSWVRLRELEEFHPKKKKEDEPEEAEAEKAAAPPPAEPSSRTRLLQRLIPALLTMGLVVGAIYVYVTDDAPEKETRTQSTRTQRRQRTPQDLVNLLKQGDSRAKKELIKAGSRSVPALIQAMLEKGSPIHPKDVRAILIEIGPSSASAIGDALEGLDLSKAARIILVEVLGEFGGMTSVPALIIALGNPNPEVQERAIEAISKLDPAFGPALARHFTSPIEDLSKQQKMNLAKALGEHRSPASIPTIQTARKAERDAEVIEALAKAVEQISRNPRTSDPVPTVVVQNKRATRQEPQRETEPAKNISVHVSASATATATAESDDKEDDPADEEDEPSENDPIELAEKLAEEGRQLREQGKEDEALEKYRQAYALHPIRAYLIIIFELEGTPDSTMAEPDSTSPPPLPEIEVPKEITLSEIYDELEQPEPDLGSYSGSLGTWSGTIDTSTPFGRDGRRDLFVVRGPSGQDFIAAVRRRELSAEDVGADRTWRGTLQGFRVTEVDGESRMLPVLSVE